MIWLGLGLFFVVFPAIVAFQSGRPSALALPVALIVVCAQWALLAGQGEEVPVVGLGLAIVGLGVTLCALRLGRRRNRRPRRIRPSA